MNNKFTSRGYTYEFIKNPREFAELYIRNSDGLSDKELTDCLSAEANPQKGIYKVRLKDSNQEEHFIFYFEKEATEDNILLVCLESIETVANDTITLCEAYGWAVDLTENFYFLLNKLE